LPEYYPARLFDNAGNAISAAKATDGPPNPDIGNEGHDWMIAAAMT
jgi:hypothetical protein